MDFPDRFPQPPRIAIVESDNQILAVALQTPPQKLVLSKGPVYTPPDYRRKGYAMASVATLSQTLLDQGCDRCFLFTDLTNPTSNHIYQTIGYQPVCDWHGYELS